MDARLDYHSSGILQKFVKHLSSAAAAVPQGTLPPATVNLVLTRASQINGCAVCVDMHTKDAAHAGETSVRLNLVAAWRDAKVFTDAERAALELTEQGTRIADAAGGVTDEAWANAARHYDTDQLAALVCTIAMINTYNRAVALCGFLRAQRPSRRQLVTGLPGWLVSGRDRLAAGAGTGPGMSPPAGAVRHRRRACGWCA
jgi:AhpD family alkylhydroperoxidase